MTVSKTAVFQWIKGSTNVLIRVAGLDGTLVQTGITCTETSSGASGVFTCSITSAVASSLSTYLFSGYDSSTGKQLFDRAIDLVETAGTYYVQEMPTALMIANDVWSATTRVLTAFGFTVDTNANSTDTAIKAKTDLIGTNSADSPNAVTAQATIATILTDVAAIPTSVPTAVQIRQEMDSNSTKLASAATATNVTAAVTAIESVVDGNITSAVTTLAADIAAINFSPSITIPPAVAVSSLTPGYIGVTRGDTLTVTLPLLGNIASRTKLVWTLKLTSMVQSSSNTDSQAIIQVSESGGLLTLNGATATDSTQASLTVTNATTGAVTLTLKPSVTSVIPIEDAIWDSQFWVGTIISTPINGTFGITGDVTQSIT